MTEFSPFPPLLLAPQPAVNSLPASPPLNPLFLISLIAPLKCHPKGTSQSSSCLNRMSPAGFELADRSLLLETLTTTTTTTHTLRATSLCIASHQSCHSLPGGALEPSLALFSPSLPEPSHPCLWLHLPQDAPNPQFASPIPDSLLIFQTHGANCLLDSSSKAGQTQHGQTELSA